MQTQEKDFEDFKKELQILINKHSIDNFCDVPDYILVKHLIKEIKNIKVFVQQYNFHIDYKHPSTFLSTDLA